MRPALVSSGLFGARGRFLAGEERTFHQLRLFQEFVIKRIRASGAKRVWAYFNNDREGYAIKNARAFLRLLREGAGPRL